MKKKPALILFFLLLFSSGLFIFLSQFPSREKPVLAQTSQWETFLYCPEKASKIVHEDGGGNVCKFINGGCDEGDRAEFQVNIPQSGYYNIQVRVKDQKGAGFDIEKGTCGRDCVIYNHCSNVGSDWVTLNMGNFRFDAGINTLIFRAREKDEEKNGCPWPPLCTGDRGTYFDWIKISQVTLCQDDDGICPEGCTPENDNDCREYCITTTKGFPVCIKLNVPGNTNPESMRNYWPLVEDSCWKFDCVSNKHESSINYKLQIKVASPEIYEGQEVTPVEFFKNNVAGYWGPDTNRNLRWMLVDFDQSLKDYLWGRGDKRYYRDVGNTGEFGTFQSRFKYESLSPEHPPYLLFPQVLRSNPENDGLGNAFVSRHQYYSCGGQEDCSPQPFNQHNSWFVGWTNAKIKVPYFGNKWFDAKRLEQVELSLPGKYGDGITDPYRDNRDFACRMDGNVLYYRGVREDWFFVEGVGLALILTRDVGLDPDKECIYEVAREDLTFANADTYSYLMEKGFNYDPEWFCQNDDDLCPEGCTPENDNDCVTCTLTKASWIPDSASGGESVQLIVEGENCAGQTANLSFWEEDKPQGLLGKALSTVQSFYKTLTGKPIMGEPPSNDPLDPGKYNLPETITFEEDRGTTSWQAVWFEDTDGPDPDPEIFFEARIGESTTRFNVLTISKPPCQDDDGVCSEGCTPENDNDCLIIFRDNFETDLSSWQIMQQNPPNEIKIEDCVDKDGRCLTLDYQEGKDDYLWLKGTFDSSTNILVRVFFYDDLDESLGTMVEVKNRDETAGTALGIMTNCPACSPKIPPDSNHYAIRINSLSGTISTGVARTRGWHMFEIIVTDRGTYAKIDNKLVKTKAGGGRYITVVNHKQTDTSSLHFVSSWGFWNTFGKVYYDDVLVVKADQKPWKDQLWSPLESFYQLYQDIDFSALYTRLGADGNDLRSLLNTAFAFYLYGKHTNNAAAVNRGKKLFLDSLNYGDWENWSGHKEWARGAIGESFLLTGFLIWEELTPQERARFQKIVFSQADAYFGPDCQFLAPCQGVKFSCYPQSCHEDDTKAEENAWNAMFLSTAANLFPFHQNAPLWEKRARCFAYHAITTSTDSPYCEIETQTVYDDFTLENHGQDPDIIEPNPVYSASTIGHLTTGALSYKMTGKETPEELKHNVLNLFDRFDDFIDPNAYQYTTPPVWSGSIDSLYHAVLALSYVEDMGASLDISWQDFIQKRSLFYYGIPADFHRPFNRPPKAISEFTCTPIEHESCVWFLNSVAAAEVYGFAILYRSGYTLPPIPLFCQDDDDVCPPGCTPQNDNDCVTCALTNASWSKDSASEGESLQLTVKGENCAGQTAKLSFWEEDKPEGLVAKTVATGQSFFQNLTGRPILGEPPANDPLEPEEHNLPQTITFEENKATATWQSEWFQDPDGPDPDPELLFQAEVKESLVESRNVLLVREKPCQDGDGVCPEGCNYENDHDCVPTNIWEITRFWWELQKKRLEDFLSKLPSFLDWDWWLAWWRKLPNWLNILKYVRDGLAKKDIRDLALGLEASFVASDNIYPLSLDRVEIDDSVDKDNPFEQRVCAIEMRTCPKALKSRTKVKYKDYQYVSSWKGEQAAIWIDLERGGYWVYATACGQGLQTTLEPTPDNVLDCHSFKFPPTLTPTPVPPTPTLEPTPPLVSPEKEDFWSFYGKLYQDLIRRLRQFGTR